MPTTSTADVATWRRRSGATPGGAGPSSIRLRWLHQTGEDQDDGAHQGGDHGDPARPAPPCGRRGALRGAPEDQQLAEEDAERRGADQGQPAEGQAAPGPGHRGQHPGRLCGHVVGPAVGSAVGSVVGVVVLDRAVGRNISDLVRPWLTMCSSAPTVASGPPIPKPRVMIPMCSTL